MTTKPVEREFSNLYRSLTSLAFQKPCKNRNAFLYATWAKYLCDEIKDSFFEVYTTRDFSTYGEVFDVFTSHVKTSVEKTLTQLKKNEFAYRNSLLRSHNLVKYIQETLKMELVNAYLEITEFHDDALYEVLLKTKIANLLDAVAKNRKSCVAS